MKKLQSLKSKRFQAASPGELLLSNGGLSPASTVPPTIKPSYVPGTVPSKDQDYYSDYNPDNGDA